MNFPRFGLCDHPKSPQNGRTTGTSPDIRDAIHTTRSDLRRKGEILVPAAARVTSEPKPVALDESDVFACITKANKAAHLWGGVAKAREIAEAIRVCGGIMLAEILGPDTEL